MLIIVVLFITLPNLKQLIYQKVLFLKIVGKYKKILFSISVYSRQFFLLFLFTIHKIVDIMDVYKSLNISIGTVMKNPKMLKFVSDHLKTNHV